MPGTGGRDRLGAGGDRPYVTIRWRAPDRRRPALPSRRPSLRHQVVVCGELHVFCRRLGITVPFVPRDVHRPSTGRTPATPAYVALAGSLIGPGPPVSRPHQRRNGSVDRTLAGGTHARQALLHNP